jgi:hypothetical protein
MWKKLLNEMLTSSPLWANSEPVTIISSEFSQPEEYHEFPKPDGEDKILTMNSAFSTYPEHTRSIERPVAPISADSSPVGGRSPSGVTSAAARSPTIKILQTARPESEVQLDHDEAVAAYRDHLMFERIMRGKQAQKNKSFEAREKSHVSTTNTKPRGSLENAVRLQYIREQNPRKLGVHDSPWKFVSAASTMPVLSLAAPGSFVPVDEEPEIEKEEGIFDLEM